MAAISFSEQQHTADINHTSTKLTKLITVRPFYIIFKYYYDFGRSVIESLKSS